MNRKTTSGSASYEEVKESIESSAAGKAGQHRSPAKTSARPSSRPTSKTYREFEAQERSRSKNAAPGRAASGRAVSSRPVSGKAVRAAAPAAAASGTAADRKREERTAYPTPEPEKTAPKKKKRKSSAARKRRTLQKVKITFLLLLILALVGAAGFGAVYYLRGGNLIDLNKPFSLSEEFANNLTRKEELRAEPFAENLCVITEDIPLETAALGGEQHGVLIDLDRNKAIFAQGVHDKVYPASITKIMTGLLALKYGDLSETVTITQEDLNLEEQAQVCGFTVGSEVTMEQLLYCLLVYSGNDAAAAIARTIGGNETDFVSMMNTYAEQLGCTGTHFTNPHGLQDEDHYTTVYDIYLMLNEAYKYPIFTEISQLPSYTVTYKRGDGTEMAQYLEATDHYLTGEATAPRDVTILGGKTGTTTEAGNCLALLSQNAYGHPFVSIVMGADSKNVLYQEMNSLLQSINDPV